MENYKVEIRETSKEFTAKERLLIKDTTASIKLDEATKDGKIVFKPTDYAVLSIHNEKSDNKDYEVFVVLADDGYTYTTGSHSFFDSFMNIWNEMKNETEDWQLVVYREPSKNYKGKDFITCTIA